MSELINTSDNRATIRWKLLTGASALALVACISAPTTARAEDASRPLIWLEFDGQFAMQKNGLDIYSPAFLSNSQFGGASHLGLEKTRPNIWNKGASLSFQPQDSDWIVSGSIRFGQIGRSERLNQITSDGVVVFQNPILGNQIAYPAYQDFRTRASESHTIADFQVGKDVGIGRFGSEANSVVNLGVRFAQFHSSNHVGIASRPTNCVLGNGALHCHSNSKFYASFDGEHRFQGIGPMLSWNASAMVAGNPSDGGLSLDWSVNGALLFGRQKTSEQHQTTRQRFSYHSYPPPTRDTPVPVSRSKRVTVPNLGGFAGVSWRYAAAKVTLGYRADYFFGVLDGGIDAAKKEDRGFYGPFVSIAVGIGD